MFGAMVYYAFFLAVRLFVIRFLKGKTEFIDQRIIPWFKNHNIEVTCLTFILEGNLDIAFWAFICIMNIKNNNIGRHFSDVFSNLIAFVILLLLACAPIYLLYKAVNYIKQVEKRKQK